MLNNFIGGGQVFLHKIRMFSQVFFRTLHVSMFIGILIAIFLNWSAGQKVDWDGFLSYRKAKVTIEWDTAFANIKKTIERDTYHVTYINAKSGNNIWEDINPHNITRMHLFQKADQDGWNFLVSVSWLAGSITVGCFILVFLIWSRFGSALKEEKKKDGSAEVLTSAQVRLKLRSLRLASDFKIGKMPLVKDMETRHFLVTGSTGSGKTNLMHNLLPQIEAKQQPAVVIDQTGEMIAKYYNEERGDIIFNPFDARSKSWDFWDDCASRTELERFSKILIGFNRKQSGSHSDPFWENSAEAVFNASIEYLRPSNASIKTIANMVCYSDLEYLKTVLRNSKAGRYLSADAKQTAASTVSVLASNAKPLTYLHDVDKGNSFSMKKHFSNIANGSNAWLFLATKPSSRELTLPLIACLTELALSQLMNTGVDRDRKVWFIIDELAALGKLPALPTLMAEGRKYGACVVGAMQSLNQLYSNYGHYDGSTIFGQFGTSFFFRNTEPAIAKMVSEMCGSETITRHQKNTSFGANTFRDGVSYSEQQQKKAIVEIDDLASLAVGQCYMLISEPSVRLSKIQTPESNLKNKNQAFIEPDKEEERDFNTIKQHIDVASNIDMNDEDIFIDTDSSDAIISSESVDNSKISKKQHKDKDQEMGF